MTMPSAAPRRAYTGAQSQWLNAMIRYQDVPNGHMGPDEVAVLHPDIAAALGIEAVDHD